MGNIHYLKEVQDLYGFVLESCLKGSKIKIMSKGFLHSEQDRFHIQMKEIMRIVPQITDKTNSFLIVIHEDKSAHIYIDDIGLNFSVKLKRDVNIEVGNYIPMDDLLDFYNMSFDGITILKSDKIIFGFRIEWRFGLYFNLNNEKNTDVDLQYKNIATSYKILLYYPYFKKLSIPSLSRKFEKDGWFWFISLKNSEINNLIYVYETNSLKKKNERLQIFLNMFTQERLLEITVKWGANSLYDTKKPILMAAINAFNSNTQEGNILCIKTLISEIEGIIRMNYCKENNLNKANFNQLKNYIKEKGQDKFNLDLSMAFTEDFYDYLRTVVFNKFDINTDKIETSRHSVGHGVASVESYTKSKALQAILILDQIYYYIS